MTNISIRRIEGEELLDHAFPMWNYAFGESPKEQKREDLEKHLPYQVDKHIIALFEDEKSVATATNIHMTQNVRGKVFPMGGVAGVASGPETRRKGYVKKLMGKMFENMRDTGEVVSGLFPFRESFYGRMGYVGFPQMRLMEFSPLHLSPLLKADISGDVEVCHIKEGFDTYWEFMKDIQPDIHGLALHPESAVVRLRDRGNYWLAIARHEGKVLGLMLYGIAGYGKELNVSEFFYTNSQGKYLLMQWLARHGDHVKTIWLKSQATDLLEIWSYDLQLAVHTRHSVSPFHPTPMGRVVIVEDLGGIRIGDSKFSATITDSYCEWNNGSFVFEVVEGKLQVSRTNKADSELSIEGLSALVFCGSDPADFVYRGWGNPSDEVQAAMREMFAPAFPFIHTDF